LTAKISLHVIVDVKLTEPELISFINKIVKDGLVSKIISLLHFLYVVDSHLKRYKRKILIGIINVYLSYPLPLPLA